MDSKLFITGVALGMIGGALLVCNSQKLNKMIKCGEACVKEKAEELLKNADEKTESEKPKRSNKNSK